MENLRILFEVFDKDGNGVIDLSELNSTFAEMENKRQIDEHLWE
jgi:Ca2+-binding EF-hand superfamily protein